MRSRTSALLARMVGIASPGHISRASQTRSPTGQPPIVLRLSLTWRSSGVLPRSRRARLHDQDRRSENSRRNQASSSRSGVILRNSTLNYPRPPLHKWRWMTPRISEIRAEGADSPAVRRSR